MPLLILAFLVIPVVELAVIIQVGQVIGLGWTLLLLLALSVAGAWLVKREGRRAWTAFRVALAQGRWPGDEVVHGALILLGGALLVTPGFVTDAAGLLLMLPPTRAIVARAIRLRVTPVPVQAYQAARGAQRRLRQRPAARNRSGDVYDVEVVSIERDAPAASADPRADDERTGSG